MGAHLAPEISRAGALSFTLRAAQKVSLGLPGTFSFFEDPANLPSITPPWLQFRTITGCGGACEGAEYDYTIRWFGVPLPWRTRITEYTRGVSFTDCQIRGPYRSWVHRHTFREFGDGTLMEDRVDFTLPWPAMVFAPVIRRQLADIFRFRARRIGEWAAGNPARAEA